MKSKNMTLMAIAIGCGLVAALLTAKFSGGNATETVDVIVAKRELTPGTILAEKDLDSMVGYAKFPKNSIPPDAVVNMDDLKGKMLNRMLKTGNFFSQGDIGVDNGTKLPEGMYKYAVKTDGVKAVAGFVQPGDHVDVQLTETQQNGKVKAAFILRDVLVLSVGTRQVRTPNGEAVPQVESVSLAVTSQQSLYLSAAERRGDVKLVLRDINNTDKSEVGAIDKLPGIDDKTNSIAGPAAVKTTIVVCAKAEVPANTFINKDNFGKFFTTREIPEEGVSSKAVHDPSSLFDKYVTKAIEPDEQVFMSWLSEQKPEQPKIVMAEPGPSGDDPPEVLPNPREKERPLYPRRFEQVINNQHFWFIETAPGEFRRADAAVPDALKDLPDSNGTTPQKPQPEPPEMKEPQKKPDDRPGDRPV